MEKTVFGFFMDGDEGQQPVALVLSTEMLVLLVQLHQAKFSVKEVLGLDLILELKHNQR